MTTDERTQLATVMTESQSTGLAPRIYELSRQLARAIHHATTPEHLAKLDAMREQAENARQLCIATHDELAELYRTVPSDAPTAVG